MPEQQAVVPVLTLRGSLYSLKRDPTSRLGFHRARKPFDFDKRPLRKLSIQRDRTCYEGASVLSV